MNVFKAKTLGLVFALLVSIGLVTAGCKQEVKNSWVNTNSLPGRFFKQPVQVNARQSNSTTVYLGARDNSNNVKFGPRDISFEFRSLK